MRATGRWRRRLRLALATAVLAMPMAVPACSDATGISPLRLVTMRSELDHHERKWQGQGIASYSVHFRRLCGECLEEWTRPMLIEVRDRAVVDVRYVSDGSRPASLDLSQWPTVDSVFALLRRTLEAQPVQASIEYDRTFGYPTNASFDPHADHVDDEFGVTLGALQPLPQAAGEHQRR